MLLYVKPIQEKSTSLVDYRELRFGERSETKLVKMVFMWGLAE